MLPVQRARFELVEEENQRERNLLARTTNRRMRDTSDPFALSDTRFIELFRLNKELVHYLIVALTPFMQAPQRTTAIPPAIKIFAALRFFATGSYQRTTGQNFLTAMSQQSVGRAISEVSACVITHLCNEWIKFPVSVEEKRKVKQLFMEKTGFPGSIGAVDCTHVAILKPAQEEHNYLNRKGYHSKNVQIIADYNLKIMAINARYAGATHDSFIWRHSAVHEYLHECYNGGERNTWVLGDSGYPLQPWVMTPVPNAVPGSAEERFNTAHARARNCVERCNGVLKMRFRCLLGERVLRYSPEIAGSIITTCAVLHNMCVEARVPFAEVAILEQEGLVNDRHLENQHIYNEGVNTRVNLINNYFQ